jgi:outer membrane protein TolC
MWKAVLASSFALAWVAALAAAPPPALELPPAAPQAGPPPPPLRITLDEVKQRILADSKLLQMAALNVRSKEYATRAMKANYFPQIIGSSVYFHFSDNLGDVVTTGGRRVTGPRGTPLGTLPTATFDIPVILQDSSFTTITAVQPITDLLKVRQGVKIARADEAIAQAQMEKGTRELLSGAEQLYWGLLAAQRIRAGLQASTAGAEALAKTGNLEARTALVQGQQALGQVQGQIAELQEQLAALLSLPLCTQFELVEPPLPAAPVRCAEEAIDLALASSPEVREAAETVAKASAAVAAAKVDYLPNVVAFGGYANNSGMLNVIQPNFSYVGVGGSYTFVDWGKRRNTVRERRELEAAASLKVQQTRDDVAKEAAKAFREYNETEAALKLAGDLLELRKEALKAAAAPAAQFAAGKDEMTAEVDYIKADLAHRTAYVKLKTLLGHP